MQEETSGSKDSATKTPAAASNDPESSQKSSTFVDNLVENLAIDDEDAEETKDQNSDTEDEYTKIRLAGAEDKPLDFSNVIREVNKINFKIITVKGRELPKILTKFVAIGSIIHKLSPDDLTIVANMDGPYDGKEVKDTHLNDGKNVPNTLLGLLANGTKFFDAVIYLGMEPSRRSKPSVLELKATDDEMIEVPTYDDLTKLTT